MLQLYVPVKNFTTSRAFKNVKNSKKTWDLIREVTFGHESKKSNVEKITVNNSEINDPQLIADEFNNFFTEIGSKISNSIQPTITQPENYLTDLPNIRQLDLGQTGPVHFCDTLKSFEPKKKPRHRRH